MNMRLHRFFIGNQLPETGHITLDSTDLIHQLRNVFRFMVGNQLILLDGSGKECIAMVVEISAKSVTVDILSCIENKNIPRVPLTLFCAISKKDTFEWVVQKGTEVGVSRFVPLQTRRGEKKKLNFERLHRIAKEASEQSGRGTIPEVKDITTIEEVLKNETMHFIAFDENGTPFVTTQIHDSNPVGVFIGPEGGWSDEEKMYFKKEDVPLYSLGAGTLRTETAAIVASALVLLG